MGPRAAKCPRPSGTHVSPHHHGDAAWEMRSVRTSAADGLSLLVNQEQDEGQAEDAHDARARRQCSSRDICNTRGQFPQAVAEP